MLRDAFRAFTHTATTRLSADDSRRLPVTGLYEGKEGVQSVLAKYPELDLSKEKDTFTKTLHGVIEYEFGTHPEDVKYIVDLGGDVNTADKKNSPMLPLGRACSRAKGTGVCEVLIDAGAHLDQADTSGMRPIDYAMDTDRRPEEKIALLAKRGAKLNVPRAKAPKTPLCYAASNGNVELGIILARNGADTKITDSPESPGNLALKDAIQNSNFSFVDFLLESESSEKPRGNKKLNPFLKQAIDSTTERPLSEAELDKIHEPNSRMAIISTLVDKGADLNSLNKETARKFWKSLGKVMHISPEKIDRDIEAAYGEKEFL